MPQHIANDVVVVDDDADDVFFFERLLTKAGVNRRLIVLRSGEDALSFFGQAVAGKSGELPLVCFLDVKMPGTSGFDVLKWIRANEALDRMPVVMLSSSDERRDLARAVQLGAQCYLRKPPSPDLVLETIRHAATHAAASDPNKPAFDFAGNLLVPKAR
jgi:CheY-like chemotaxis protein